MLQLFRNGVPADFPPIYAGRAFYYGAGQIGHSDPFDGWTHEQAIYEELGEPEIGEDGQPIEQELVVKEVVTWSLVAAPPELIDEPEPPTPEQIRAAMPQLSPVQFRFLLLSIGFSGDDVNAAIAAIPDPVAQEKASIYWEYATYFERLNPLIDQIGALLGLTPEQIDEAWLAFAEAGE